MQKERPQDYLLIPEIFHGEMVKLNIADLSNIIELCDEKHPEISSALKQMLEITTKTTIKTETDE